MNPQAQQMPNLVRRDAEPFLRGLAVGLARLNADRPRNLYGDGVPPAPKGAAIKNSAFYRQKLYKPEGLQVTTKTTLLYLASGKPWGKVVRTRVR